MRDLLVTAADSWSRAGALAAELGTGARRDVLVAHGPADGATVALLTGFALRTGAALLVEPVPPRWPLALVWARPTVVAGDAADLARLADSLQRLESKPTRLRRKRGPLGRVRAVVRVERDITSEASVFWTRLGLPFVQAPDARGSVPQVRPEAAE